MTQQIPIGARVRIVTVWFGETSVNRLALQDAIANLDAVVERAGQPVYIVDLGDGRNLYCAEVALEDEAIEGEVVGRE